jgi:hypothetical protein
MHLTPREQDKLLVYLAARLARERQARGLKLNHPRRSRSSRPKSSRAPATAAASPS